MHCPSCGAETTLDQRFCRSCGMDLETVSKLVAEHSSPDRLKLEKSLSEKASQQRMYHSLKWGMICLILGMAVLTVVKTLALDKTFNLAGALLLFMAMGLMCYSVLAPLHERASNSKKLPESDRTGELPETETTKELPPARVPVPVASVTERTTQLIASEKAGTPRK
ncbi:MAG: zinc ribbon domain-containing protein [Pyrinomonadaceae bacterium]